jgi:RNA polymerase sigma-70 factor (ECF subfamily)
MNPRLRALAQRDPLSDPEPLVRRVHAYVAYRMGDGPDAEDVTNETFARALRYRDTFDASKGTPINWLIGIARRCVDESFSRVQPLPDPPDRKADGELEADAVERLTVQAAVSRLDERDRELIALRYGADLSARQIAQRLELSTNAVDVALHRARARLREELDGGAGRPAADNAEAPDEDRPVRKRVPAPVSTPRRPSKQGKRQ